MSKLEIGVLAHLSADPQKDLRKVANLGLNNCQVCTWNPELWTPQIGQKLLGAAREFGIRITTQWTGYPGPKVWNFIKGPTTIGLVPREYRQQRLEVLKKGAEFAASLKLPSITTHAGFIPEDPNDPEFAGTVAALKELAIHCKGLGIELWFETGQETPVVLLRTFEHIGTDNLGVNLDPANLILYGKGNPVDSLDVFGKYIRGVHAKDGLYPTNGSELGKETPIGKGRVDFQALIAALKKLGYSGPLTIEREIEGDQQVRDIKESIAYLQAMC